MEQDKIYTALIVGLDRNYTQPIREVLLNTGLFSKIRVAYSGPEVNEVLTEVSPDLLITDIVLRETDGLSIVEEIRRHGNPHCKVIICTAIASEFIIQRSFKYGADFFVQKPFAMPRLSKIVQDLMGEYYLPYCRREERQEILALGLIQRIGLPAGTKGYQYALSALKRILKDPSLLERMMTDLYPSLAEEFGTTPLRVERNLRHVIEVAWEKGDINYIEDLFGYTVDEEKGKPTTTGFLATAADYIQRSLYCVESEY